MLATYSTPAPAFLGVPSGVLRAMWPIDQDEEAFERFEDDGGPSAPGEDGED